jgi:3-oxoacyl-[acyl-carrier protein] reductase
MDLGIAGRSAIVCGASRGLGAACAEALVREGVNVTLVARGAEALERTAGRLRDLGVGKAKPVAGDIATAEGRERALAACPSPDIVVTNAGGPPPGDFRAWTRDDWLRALDANMLAPIELIRATVDGMIGRGFGRIVNITSGATKAPIDALGLSNGARAGLTGFVAGLARKTVAHNVTINTLLPSAIETERLRVTAAAQYGGKDEAAVEAALERRRATIPAGRFGRPAEFGAICAFLCSVHTGFVTGQNVLVDGGAYPGVF